jgi:hypothetical protein
MSVRRNDDRERTEERMKREILAVLAVALTVGGGPQAVAGPGHSDLVVMASGADVGGEPMTLSCELAFAAVPSNRFTGECQISVGPDHVLLGGIEVDGVPLLTVVLNGELTVHGLAQVGSGRFRQLANNGIAGFPMIIEIDPLSRAWAIRGDAPDGPRQTISRGSLHEGAINLALPPSLVPTGLESGIAEGPMPRRPGAR